jgi:RNA polymerase sigma factor (sigma-70 family)
MEPHEYNDCVKQWADAVFRFARKSTGHEEDARDIVQASFEVLWQKRKDVQVEKAKAFLFQVAYRQSVDNYRRRAKYTSHEGREEEMAGTVQQTDLKRVLERALSKLDERSRALVLLKDYEGYHYDEIGRITGLNENQVKVYLHRARKILKDYLVRVEHII